MYKIVNGDYYDMAESVVANELQFVNSVRSIARTQNRILPNNTHIHTVFIHDGKRWSSLIMFDLKKHTHTFDAPYIK